jgi:TonB family protein
MAASAGVMSPIIWRPAIVTLLLHVAMLYLLTVNWASSTETEVTPKALPKHIQARLIDAQTLQPKKKKPPVRKAVPAAKPKPVAAKPKPAPAKPKPVAEPKPVEPRPAEPPQPSAEERAEALQQELALALDAEDVLLEEASDLEVAQSYVALIARTVEENWSRPPSARNGMEAELALQLIPTGEVVNVSLSRSSGNSAFDRSAINAVQKAERFPELQNVPSRIFEKNFRRLRLKFKPEDLRF